MATESEKVIMEARELVARLHGLYPMGPILPNGEPEFGYRVFDMDHFAHVGICKEAANTILKLLGRVAGLEDFVDQIPVESIEKGGMTIGKEEFQYLLDNEKSLVETSSLMAQNYRILLLKHTESTKEARLWRTVNREVKIDHENLKYYIPMLNGDMSNFETDMENAAELFENSDVLTFEPKGD